MKNEKIQMRHGDVLLTKIGECVDTPVNPKPKKVIVAEGEVTGHAHIINAIGLKYDARTQKIEIPFGGQITHEEHGVLELERGIYEVRRQQEWIEQKMARVRD
jgi:hypothetical protein